MGPSELQSKTLSGTRSLPCISLASSIFTTMLSRLLPKPSHLRSIIFNCSKSNHHYQPQSSKSFPLSRFFSTDGNDGNNDGRSDNSTSSLWKISRETDGNFDHLFSKYDGNLDGIHDSKSPAAEDETWLTSKGEENGGEGNIFEGIEKEIVGKNGGDGENEWATADGFKPWSLVEEETIDVFGAEKVVQEVGKTSVDKRDADEKSSEEAERLEKEEQELTAILKGPTRAFGDLIAASGITDEMLDSLIALKDLEGVEGLPPLSVIEDMRYEKNTRKSSRAEIELQKQEEVAKSRVRQVDDKGRSYGTGRRKCSIARVWVQPGEGKFIVNEKEFDVYFPMLDSRAALLRPFSETKTLGLWDVQCTVKGGGISGQVGAIRLGISRALQNWEPDLRPPLRDAGFLTRDSRAVERKKPGKAKARKSFQWVKR